MLFPEIIPVGVLLISVQSGLAGSFFSNTAELYIVRVDRHLHQDWEAMLEGRALTMPDLNQTRSGLLAAAYRHFGKNVKAGLGYNFTNFSEVLTDMSFKSHGIFMNVVGAM